MADVHLAARSRGRPQVGCGICARPSLVTPCLRCLMVIDRIAAGEVRGKRVPLVREVLKQPLRTYAVCKGCGRVLSYSWQRPMCSKCEKKTERERRRKR